MAAKSQFLKYLALVSAMLLTLALAANAASSKAEWVLHQKQRDSGNQTVYITDDAIKIVNEESGYQVVARAPTWDVIIYRPDNKLAMKTTVIGFRRFSPFGPLLSRGESSSFVLEKSDTIAGVAANKLSKSSGAQLWVASAIKAAPEISDMLQSYDRFPIAGIPLKYRSRNDTPDAIHTAQKLLVETFDAKKIARVEKDFEYPTPKRWVKTQSEVLSSVAKMKELNSIMDDLGVGSKLGN
jgi:hypothetical protein